MNNLTNEQIIEIFKKSSKTHIDILKSSGVGGASSFNMEFAYCDDMNIFTNKNLPFVINSNINNEFAFADYTLPNDHNGNQERFISGDIVNKNDYVFDYFL